MDSRSLERKSSLPPLSSRFRSADRLTDRARVSPHRGIARRERSELLMGDDIERDDCANRYCQYARWSYWHDIEKD